LKTLLRSCFASDPNDPMDLLVKNFHALADSALVFDTTEDNEIWHYIKDFFLAHTHVPSYPTIRSFLDKSRKSNAVDRLDLLVNLQPKYRGDFISYLEEQVDLKRNREWQIILKEAQTIASSGLEITKGKDQVYLQGPIASASYIIERTHDIVAPVLTGKISGEVTGDGKGMIEDYERIERDPNSKLGFFTGVAQIDEKLKGAKRNELWLHAAFTGGLKSTFLFNWVYNLSVWYRHDSCIFSLEMPYDQCRRILYAIHSIHPKFTDIRLELGIQSDPQIDVGLAYDKIKEGLLSPKEKDFFFNYVVKDFNDKSNNYGTIHIEVADPSKDQITIPDIRRKAEMIYATSPFGFLAIDHAGLVASRRRYQSTTESLNEVLRDCKKLSMSFNKGQGIATVIMYQISREGYKQALKRKEKHGTPEYDLTALSYSNEAERSSDIITATFVDDEYKSRNRVLFQSLKTRDGGGFAPFEARVEWTCRKIFTCLDTEDIQTDGLSIETLGANL
jgi:hypothetical protein